MKRSNDRLAALHIATLLGIVGLHWTAVTAAPTVVGILTAPIAGFAMACMLSVVHEASHEVYVSNRVLNRVIGFVYALYIGMNFRLYRREHGLHHAHFATPLDPEGTTLVRNRGDLLRVLLRNATPSPIGAAPSPPSRRCARPTMWRVEA